MKKREDAHYRKIKEGRQDTIQNQETRNCFSLLPTDFLGPHLPQTAAFIPLLFIFHKPVTLFHQFQTLICLFLYNSMPSYGWLKVIEDGLYLEQQKLTCPFYIYLQ